MSFRSLYRHGFARVAAGTIAVSLADPEANAAAILRSLQDCHARGVAVAVFPELSLSAYSIEDLLLQDPLLDAVETALAGLAERRGLSEGEAKLHLGCVDCLATAAFAELHAP